MMPNFRSLFRLIALTLFICCALPSMSAAQTYPSKGLLAHYTFNGNGKDITENNPDFVLRGVTFVDNALFLDGRYEFATPQGYRAIGSTPAMSYELFSVVIRFKLATPREGASQPNLITGGTSYRWFGLRFSHRDGGRLIVYFDNGDFAQRIEGTEVRANQWVTVVCTVDIPSRRVLVYRDGGKVGTIDLPKDFVMDAVSADLKGQDKEWTFTNYSGANTYHGWVDDLAIYGRVLTADEIAKISPRP